ISRIWTERTMMTSKMRPTRSIGRDSYSVIKSLTSARQTGCASPAPSAAAVPIAGVRNAAANPSPSRPEQHRQKGEHAKDREERGDNGRNRHRHGREAALGAQAPHALTMLRGGHRQRDEPDADHDEGERARAEQALGRVRLQLVDLDLKELVEREPERDHRD